MDMRKNEKGSSLIFALAVISIITMVIAACMAISYSYYNRSIAANSERQAYLTAKSVLSNIVDNIVDENSDYTNLIPSENEKKYTVSEEFSELKMGKINVVSFYNDRSPVEFDKLTITVKATYGNKEKTIKADLHSEKDKNKWKFIKYYEDDSEQLSENVLKGIAMIDHQNHYLNLFKSDRKDAFLDELKADPEIVRNMTESKASYPTRFDNTQLRTYYYYGVYNQKWPTLNSSTLDLPAEYKGKIFYIKPYFVYSAYSYCITYATSDSGELDGWKPELVYNPEKKHWYYFNTRDKKHNFGMTQLNGDTPQAQEEAFAKFNELCTDDNLAE